MAAKIPLSDKHSGWKKDMPIRKRRNLVLRTSKAKSIKGKYLESARRMQALANLTTDRKTKMEAQRDAKYFFARYQKFS